MGLDIYIKRVRKPQWRDEFGTTMPSSWYDAVRGENLIRLREDDMKAPQYEQLAGFAVPVRVLQKYVDSGKISEKLAGGVPVSLGSIGFENGTTVYRYFPDRPSETPGYGDCVVLDIDTLEKDYSILRTETQYVFSEEGVFHSGEEALQKIVRREIERDPEQAVEDLMYCRLDKKTAGNILRIVPGLFVWSDEDEKGVSGLFYREWN